MEGFLKENNIVKKMQSLKMLAVRGPEQSRNMKVATGRLAPKLKCIARADANKVH